MKKSSILLPLLAVSMMAFAGSSSEGLVTIPLATDYGAFIFSAGTPTNKPSCSTATAGNYAVNLNTAGGRAIQALVLTAYANGKSLRVDGKGICESIQTDRESVNYVYIVEVNGVRLAGPLTSK
ncbi:MAG: hypothetical protein K2P84_01590 [Undibacterium sp.]|nr:hypothetical protein [Undibacterium sp.]